MAITITSTTPGTSSDYARYVFGEVKKTDSLNAPDLLDFTFVPVDNSFVKLHRGNYITFQTTKYGKWFTGYITNEPEYEWIGHIGTNKVWGYKYEATSDEFILNLTPLGMMQPFMNTTQGAILKALAARLAPGKFDVTNVADGLSVSRYVVDPEKRFLDVVTDFAGAACYRFWAKDGKLYYAKQDSVSAGFVIDGNDKHFTPSVLRLTPSKSQIVNDAVVMGDLEPQGYMNEWFLGDGFTAQFPLVSSVFGTDRTTLLDDSFGSNIDTSKWVVYDDVHNYLKVSGGSLNVMGGNVNNSFDISLQSAYVIPLESNIRVTHGEFDFVNTGTNDVCQGVIGGLWTQSPNSSFTGCVSGVRVYRGVDAVTRLHPIVNGAADLTQVVTVDTTKRYILRTLFSTQAVYRHDFEYGTLSVSGAVAKFGGDSYPTLANMTTTITEVDPTTGSVTNTFIFFAFDKSIGSANVFATYIPVVSNDLHLSMTGITISVPMQAALEMLYSGESDWRQLSIGPNEIDTMDGQAPVATILNVNGAAATKSSVLGTTSYNPGQATLQFFKDSLRTTTTVPQAGDKIHLSYRRAGAAIGRVTDMASVLTESTLWGDAGLRSAVKMDLAPKPRTSSECELAAASLVTNGNYQHYEGSYNIWSDYTTAEPVAGAILHFQNLDAKLPVLQAEVITEVTTVIHSSKVERYEHDVTFGEPDRLKELLSSFAKPGDVFVPADTGELPQYVDLTSVGNIFCGDVTEPTFVSCTTTTLDFNTNQAPPTGGGFEIRYTDEGWGADDGKNLVTRTTGQTFSVPRNARGKICFVKAYDIRNLLKYSEDFSNAAWVKDGSSQVSVTEASPVGSSNVCTLTAVSGNKRVYQLSGVNPASKQAVGAVSIKGTAGQTLVLQLGNNVGQTFTTNVTLNGQWQRVTVSGTFNSSAGNLFFGIALSGTATSVKICRASAELSTLIETVYCKTIAAAYGANSRFSAGLRVEYPLIPPAPTATVDTTDISTPIVKVTLPVVQLDVWGVEIRASNNVTVLAKKNLIDSGFVTDFPITTATRALSYKVYTYNILGEYCTTPATVTYTIPTPSLSGTAVDDATMTLKWTGSNATGYTVVVSPNVDYSSPTVTSFTKDPFYQLSPADFFGVRYMQVTPSDVLGSGTPGTTSHDYTPTALLEFNDTEIVAVAAPLTLTTPPVIPASLRDYGTLYQFNSFSDAQINTNTTQ